MALKYHPTPLGGDRKALSKELGKARAMANILATRSVEMRAKGEALIQQADKHFCESWNERMRSDGEPVDHRPLSTRPSTAASPGWRFSVLDARPPAMSISRAEAGGTQDERRCPVPRSPPSIFASAMHLGRCYRTAGKPLDSK
jgi:hypothetical protein